MKAIRVRGPGARHLGPYRRQPPRSVTLNALGPVIYAVRTRDGLVKIGFTRSLAVRSSHVGSGINSILAVRLAGTLDEERAIHDTLTDHVARGAEYYYPCHEVLDVVNQLRRDIQMPPLALEDLTTTAV